MHRCARAHTLAGVAIFMQMGVELFSEKIVGAVAFAGWPAQKAGASRLCGNTAACLIVLYPL